MPKTTRIINAVTDNHRQEMRKLAEFAELDSITYRDHGNGESYLLKKAGKTLVLKVSSNRVDGGWLNIE
jgi:hypothetical protein